MTAREVDAYLADVPQPHRATLEELRATIKALIPGADEGIAYGLPAYKVNGKYIVGFGAFRNHCSYFPFSGSVFDALPTELENYRHSKGALQFAIDKPLPKMLVRKLISIRKSQIKVSKF